jgi:acyl carrier protein
MRELQVISYTEDAEQLLLKDGAVLFRDIAVSDASSFQSFADRYVSHWMEYQDRASKRSKVAGQVHTSTDTPSAFPITLHCESSFTSRWPQKIFFCCQIAPTSGGRTPICDVRRVYDDIDVEIRDKFERLGVMYYRNFGKGVGMDWRDVFQATDRQSVDSYCASNGILAEWQDDDRLRTTQVRPASLVHPRTRETVWFNHALALHKSSLSNSLAETLMRQGGESNLVNNTYYGNGEPISDEIVQHIREVHERHTIRFDWRPGDVLMLDNMLMAHGREPYEGKRLVYAAMADPLTWQDVGAELSIPIDRPQIQSEQIPREERSTLEVTRSGERDLRDWFLEAVATELELEEVDGDDSFAAIGGDSLAGVTLISEAYERYGVDLSLETLMEADSLDAALIGLQQQISD